MPLSKNDVVSDVDVILQDVEVSDVDGVWHKAALTQCRDCLGSEFFVFQVEGHKHYHLQCNACSSIYCMDPEDCRKHHEKELKDGSK